MHPTTESNWPPTFPTAPAPRLADSPAAALGLLASIVESCEDAIVSTTVDGVVTSWNQAAERMFGYTAGEMIGRSYSVCYPDERAHEFLRHRLDGSARRLDLETVRRRRDGTLIDVHLTLSPIHDAHGATTGISGIVRDITERKRVEERLAHSQSLLRQVTESIGEVFWMVDHESRKIIYVSPSFEPIWGRACESVLGDAAAWIETIHPADRERALAAFAAQLAGSSEPVEYRIVRPDGTIRFIRGRAFPVLDENGRMSRIAGVAEDVTRHAESQAALARSEFRFQRLIDSDVIGIFNGDAGGGILEANAKFLEMHGYTRDDLASGLVRWDKLTAPGFETVNREVARQLRETGRATPVENEFLRKDGTRLPVLMGLASLERGQTAIGFVMDISRRRSVEEDLRRSEEKFRQFGENIREVLWLRNLETEEILYVSPAYEEIWQRPCEGLYNNPADWMAVVHPDDRASVEAMSRCQRSGEILDNEYRIVQPSGAIRWIRDRAFPIPDGAGRMIRLGGVAEDITDRKHYEVSLRHQATHDQLTDLPNRRLLLEKLEEAIARQQNEGGELAVLFIDLDRFKLVNDSMGHAAGDDLLREVAARLAGVTRASDTLARIGGDEFTLVAPGFAEKEEVCRFARTLLDSLDAPFTIGGRELFIGASIGVALYPCHGADPEDLQRNADTAVRAAKRNGKGQIVFFSQRLTAEAQERLAVETRLRRALPLDEFRLQYQPQFAGAGTELVRFEALLRWYPRDRAEPIPPADFIHIAEESDLIVPIGHWVLHEACRAAAAWQRGAHCGIGVGVNVSARQFAQPDIVAEVAEALRVSGLPAGLLEIEVTESVFLQDLKDSARKLAQLNRLGVGIALDDFGTGYSSLSYLRNLPIDAIKIDGSFLNEGRHKQSGEAVLRCLIDLAHALGIRVVVEGVETAAQLDLLSRLGCDVMQGFLLGRPAFMAPSETPDRTAPAAP